MWLASGFERRTGLRMTVRRSSDQLDVPREVQLVAYRTAQEALTNITKHAQASAVDIDLSDREGVLTLEVTDNGIGLDPQALRKANSFGLLGLRERAAKVGGWLDVSSSPKGTSVILSVPLSTSTNPDNAANADEEPHDQGDFV
jgi:Signal transduction histidine kinase